MATCTIDEELAWFGSLPKRMIGGSDWCDMVVSTRGGRSCKRGAAGVLLIV